MADTAGTYGKMLSAYAEGAIGIEKELWQIQQGFMERCCQHMQQEQLELSRNYGRYSRDLWKDVVSICSRSN
jgi:hypothetical protein